MTTSILDAINAPYELTEAQRADVTALSAPKVPVSQSNHDAPCTREEQAARDAWLEAHVYQGTRNCD